MNRLRNRLIVAFVASTVLPLAATVAITTALLDRSLRYATTGEIDRLSRTLETTARQFYQRERAALKADALAGRATPESFAAAQSASWPPAVKAFWESGEPERFGVSGQGGDRLEYFRRTAPTSSASAPPARPAPARSASARSEGAGEPEGPRPSDNVEMYTRDLGGVKMEELSVQLRQTRHLVDDIDARDLRRGFTLTLLALLGAAWLVSLIPLAVIAQRVSRPIQQLTAALTDFAAGDWSRRIATSGRAGKRDEVELAVDAFNRMAGQLEEHRDRLVHLTRLASWQSLARKTAHELKNSLTPIRLTVEEIQARQPPSERAFVDHAVQIVISEIETLERRVRAFSEFASEPPATPETLDLNALVSERVALLRPVHPDTTCRLELDDRRPMASAAPDLVKGILTNLLQNAAEAAGAGGSILTRTRADDQRVVVEVHDSGPGLSDEAAGTLFEPTITFKKDGMGLGLSIARKNALLSGGDIVLVAGRLGGAAFRVTLPAAGTGTQETHA